MSRLNAYGQPIGPAMPDWQPCALPAAVSLTGHYCRLEPIQPERHVASLSRAFAAAGEDAWTYLPADPPAEPIALQAWLSRLASVTTERHYAIVDRHTGDAMGTLALMRMDPGNGVVEVGWVTYAPVLRRTRAATEAQYLLMQYVFEELGYRRYEWKCDALNQPSRAAAQRLGFSFEGIFRQAVVYRGRSRDTAWFSILDHEWPVLAQAFQQWLDEANFDTSGRQRESLDTLRQAFTRFD